MLSSKLVYSFIDSINSSNGYELFSYHLADGFIHVNGDRLHLLLFRSFLKEFFPSETFYMQFDVCSVLTLYISVYVE